MDRISELFNSRSSILSVYFTAGFPRHDDTLKILTKLQMAGVELVEIGMPFSDPLADGPVIQNSNNKALKNGMSLKILFKQLENFRHNITIPVVLMGYLNPVLKFGMVDFVNKCVELGIDGVIIPDLPIEYYNKHYRSLFEEKGLKNILLVTPQTPEQRIKKLDKYTSGFIYMVSSAAVTGGKSELSQQQLSYFKRMKAMKLKSPLMVGFGINDNKTFNEACKYANGAIIGSAFIRMLEKGDELTTDILNFVKGIKADRD